MKKGDLRVYWHPQVPCPAFYVPVKTPTEAAKILEVLANYDIFQFENRIKPDYANAGGLQVCDPDDKDGVWSDWYDEETGYDIDEWWNDVLSSESDRVNAR